MYRYLVIRIAGANAGKVAHRNIRLTDVSTTIASVWWLNAKMIEPGGFALRTDDGDIVLEPWGVAIWAVDENGVIRGGGILVSVDPITGAIQCMGYAGYLNQLHYRGSKTWTQADPLALTREMWDFAQQVAGTDLGMVYDSSVVSPVRVGTDDDPIGMHWWELPNLGSTVDDWARLTPFEYTESHSLQNDDTISHRLILGYPRIGTQRDDLRFATGENIVGNPTVTASAEDWASNSYVLGSGEGDTRLVGISEDTPVSRVRRDVITDRADLGTQEALHAEARRVRAASQDYLKVTSIAVRNHANAPVGSWSYGDTILVQIRTPVVNLRQWRRVVSTEIRPASTNAATLTLGDLR